MRGSRDKEGEEQQSLPVRPCGRPNGSVQLRLLSESLCRDFVAG